MPDFFQHMAGIRSRGEAVGRHLAATIRGPVLWLTLCGGLLVAAIFVGTIMMSREFRERALVNGERELENAVVLLARHFDEQFEDSDAIAADVIARLRVSDIEFARDVQVPGVESRSPRDPAIPGQRVVLPGRHFDFRHRRRDHQLVAIGAGAGAQHFRPYLLSNLQIQPAGISDIDRGGPEPAHRQPEYRHCPPAQRSKRNLSRRDDAAHQPRQL